MISSTKQVGQVDIFRSMTNNMASIDRYSVDHDHFWCINQMFENDEPILTCVDLCRYISTCSRCLYA
jgi:hypothetical protein